MISFDEAIGHIRSVANPLGTERIPLDVATGRVLARPVTARIDSPRSDVSAMDGYAASDHDLAAFPVSLKVVGESSPGGLGGRIAKGECVRIFTGAPVPDGADRIIIQEIVRRDGDLAIVGEDPGAAHHVRMRGSDFKVGDALLQAGKLLDPRALVAAAAADVADVEVYLQPRLHVICTGDELTDPGRAADVANAIPDSASLGVVALAEQWGGTCAARMRVRDQLEPLRSAAAAAIKQADIVVVTGGASVGEKDFAKAMFAPLGLELIFSKVAIKPGKPVWLGRVGETLIVGLPGNPTSALLTARLFLAPLLAGMRGQRIEAALEWRSVTLASDLGPCETRETLHRARRNGDAAEILANQDSSAQYALASADLLVRQPPNSAAVSAGTEVQAIDF